MRKCTHFNYIIYFNYFLSHPLRNCVEQEGCSKFIVITFFPAESDEAQEADLYAHEPVCVRSKRVSDFSIQSVTERTDYVGFSSVTKIWNNFSSAIPSSFVKMFASTDEETIRKIQKAFESDASD